MVLRMLDTHASILAQSTVTVTYKLRTVVPKPVVFTAANNIHLRAVQVARIPSHIFTAAFTSAHPICR